MGKSTLSKNHPRKGAKMRKYLLLLLTLSSLLFAEQKADNEELTLMYNAFLYDKDLPHAYKIAKQGVKAFPHDITWHKRLSNAALWSGKNTESMDEMVYLYKHNDDPKLAPKIITQMLAAYQYQKALPIINSEFQKNRQSSQKLLDIYEKTGDPQEAIEILKKRFVKHPDAKILAQILPLQIELGDIKGAKESVQALEHYHDISPQVALALSKYYFLQKELQKAYTTLLQAKKRATVKDIPYLERLSDFANYMGDRENMLYASLLLFHADAYRVVDLERINKEADKSQVALRQIIYKEALKKFHKKSIFIDTISQLLEAKKYEALKKELDTVLADKELAENLKEEPKLWLVKASVDEHLGHTKVAQEDLRKALRYSNNDIKIEETLLWHLINHQQYQALQKMLHNIEQNKPIPPSLYHPLCAGYFTLQEADKAIFYFHKAFKKNPKDISLQFLYSEILGSVGKEKEKKVYLNLILKKLQKRANANPKLLKNQDFLRQYLQASLPFLPYKQAKNRIEKYKKDLDKQDYWELKVLLALQHKYPNHALSSYQHLAKKDTFLALDIAHQRGDIKREKRLLHTLGLAAPHMLKIQLDEDENRLPQAIHLAKKALQGNQQNLALQQKLALLQKEYANAFKVASGYQQIGKIKKTTIMIENFSYLAQGYGLISKAAFIKFDNAQKTHLSHYHDRQTQLTLGLRKHIKDGKIEANIHYNDKREKHLGASIAIEKSISEKLSFSGKVSANERIDDEGERLMLDASKDSITLQTNYNLDKSNQLSMMVEKMRYKSNHSLTLGNGIRANFTWGHKVNEDPDITLLAMYRLGHYNEQNKAAQLSLFERKDYASRFLPEDYHDIGLGFSYGKAYHGYGKATHPHLDASLFYNTKHHKLAGEVYAGVSSSLTKEDYYDVNAFYQNAINGLSYENYGININYNHLYGE